MRFETLQLHAGQNIEEHRARAPAIVPTAAYVYKDTETASNTFSGKEKGYVYSRGHNPTCTIFEDRMIALEKGKSAVAVNSGLAAQFTALSALVVPGDNIVASSYIFGGCYLQLRDNFRGFGVETRFADSLDIQDFEKLIDDRTRCVLIDSIGNPAFLVPDFAKFSLLCNKYQIPLIVDNTLGAGGYLIRPFDNGANIVIHSATKWIGGHGTTVAGIIIENGSFKWSQMGNKFTKLSDSSFSSNGQLLTELVGDDAFMKHCRSSGVMLASAALNPFGAFQLLQGLETLSLRVERECENAAKLTDYLLQSPYIESVSYLGLKTHPSHDLAKKYLIHKNLFGSCLTFVVKDYRKDVEVEHCNGAKVIDNFKVISNTVNLGDAKTLACMPHLSTNRGTQGEVNSKIGVKPTLIRISVGIEHIDDLIEDFEQALQVVFHN